MKACGGYLKFPSSLTCLVIGLRGGGSLAHAQRPVTIRSPVTVLRAAIVVMGTFVEEQWSTFFRCYKRSSFSLKTTCRAPAKVTVMAVLV